MSTLSDEIKVAITKGYAPTLAKLINICENLHRGIEVDGYEISDIPSDSLFEQLKQKYEEVRAAVASKIATGKKVSTKKGKILSDMHMAKDAIIKNSVSLLDNTIVICMPKYDGVSCAIRFVWNDEIDSFIVDAAETRGTDVGFTHKNTNMKDRMIQLLESDTCPWIERFNKLHSKYKTVTVRGEVVLVDKSIQPAAPYVAGKINSKSKILDAEGVIGFKMFEITRMIDLEGNISVPSQKVACSLISQIDKTIPFEIIELTSDSTQQLMQVYEKWNETLDSPIDGVVYCDLKWKYPQTETEASGVNYGKYALKPMQLVPTIFERVEYKVAKDGKLSPIIFYKQVSIAGKKYAKAKSSITELLRFIEDKHVGPGSTIDLKLCASIIPKVEDVVVDTSDKPIKLITHCPDCGSELVLKRNKIATLTCINPTCKGIVIKQLVTLLKTLKITGYAEKTVENILGECGSNFMKVFDAIDEAKYKGFVKSKIDEATVGDLIYGLNLATRTSLQKIKHIWDIRNMKVNDEVEIVRDFISKYHTVITSMILAYI